MANNIFFTMVGPEERVLGHFRHETLSNDKYFIFVNKGYAKNTFVKNNLQEITDKHLIKIDHQVITTSYRDPYVFVKMFNLLSEENPDYFADKNTGITVDASTFNRQNLLILLRQLRITHEMKNIEIVYTIPNEVNPNISKGAAGYSNIPFFNGNFSINKKKLLILLIGYEIDRPLYLWRELEPSKTILALGDKPTSKEFINRNQEVLNELSSFGNNEVVGISANDPHVAKGQIIDIINSSKEEYNIFVSALNTKLQAIGLYLAWEENPSIQIVSAFPEKFSSWLTKGIKEVKRFKL